MRIAIYVAAIAACVACAPETTRTVAASTASVVFEALPYFALGVVLRYCLGRYGRWAALLAGCGCQGGAVSIPATIAAWTLFGPWIALGRFCGGVILRVIMRGVPFRARSRRTTSEDEPDAPMLDDLIALAPAALLCGIVVTFAPQLDLAHRAPSVQMLCGAVIGVFGSPCALGGIALAASLHAHAPLAAYAVLATNGIMPIHLPHQHVHRDALAYATLALACALVALNHGALLVHPRLTLPLAACALMNATFAWHARSR